MSPCKLTLLAISALTFPASTPTSEAQAQNLRQVHVIYSAFTASHVPFWLADDYGLYQKYGLDLKLVHGRGNIPVQAMVSRSTDFGAFGGSHVVNANLNGANLVAVAANSNIVVTALWTRSDSGLRKPEDLKGRAIGVSVPGGSTYNMARIALRRFGLSEQNVKFVSHPSIREGFLSLQKGLVDAAFGSAPPGPGFRLLADLAEAEIPFLLDSIVARKSSLQTDRQTIASFLKAYIEGVKLAKDNRQLAIASIVKKLKVNAEVADLGYRNYVNVWPERPYVQAESIQAILDFHPHLSAKDAQPGDFIDNSIVRNLDESGFLASVYRAATAK
jgi:NitT/TauT family transport system substrate-binding protein